MSQPQEPREIFPYEVYDGVHPVNAGKDFSVRPVPSNVPTPVEEVVKEVGPDPKATSSSAMGSAEFSDLIPSAAEAIPVGADMDPEPTAIEPLKPTSSTSPATGKSEPLADLEAAITQTTGSAKPQKRATAPKQSA